MTQTSSGTFVSEQRQDLSCAMCGKLNLCSVCRRNEYLEAQTCHWCNCLVEDGEGHRDENSRIFHGSRGNSECRYLYDEFLSRITQ